MVDTQKPSINFHDWAKVGKWPQFEADIVGSFIAQVTRKYRPQRDDEVRLDRGDLVCLWDRRYPTWWAGVNLTTGEMGFFPTTCVRIVGQLKNDTSQRYDDGGPMVAPPASLQLKSPFEAKLCRVRHGYIAQADDELTLEVGKVVVVLRVQDGWAMGISKDLQTGLFPHNHVAKLSFAHAKPPSLQKVSTSTASSDTTVSPVTTISSQFPLTPPSTASSVSSTLSGCTTTDSNAITVERLVKMPSTPIPRKRSTLRIPSLSRYSTLLSSPSQIGHFFTNRLKSKPRSVYSGA
ncbi:Protein BZZ1 [Dispira simplex]|nr:Protein BZZ1 [Dispira simplex]